MTLKIDVVQIKQPILEFGSDGIYPDPKTGLRQAGPFSLRFSKSHTSQIKIGFIGPSEMLALAREWFSRMEGTLHSQKNQLQFPDYPGFEKVLHCSILTDERWTHTISDTELQRRLALKGDERFKKVLELYDKHLRQLAERDSSPDVIVCCVPDDVIIQCATTARETAQTGKAQKVHRPNATKKKKQRESVLQLQIFDSGGSDSTEEENEDELLFRDFRRALKARAMSYRKPIQLGTTNLFLDKDTNQDPATRAWNLSVALFYKAGGIPWRIHNDGPETCFVGVSFHHLRTEKKHLVYSSVAQAFSTDGDGFALRGEPIPWTEEQGKQVHLSSAQAEDLAGKIIREYKDRAGHLPPRVVIHKTSEFNAFERAGFSKGLKDIPVVQFINVRKTSFRLLQDALYPPRRGTLCSVNDTAFYLFTSGYVPQWQTYPGPHIPVPLQVSIDSDTDVTQAAADVLALTRINWNTASDTSSIPITLGFAREVGAIMAEVSQYSDEPPLSSYKYYI